MKTILMAEGRTPPEPSDGDAFSHGYVLDTDSAKLPEVTRGWAHTAVGPATVALHPKTSACAVSAGGRRRGRRVVLVLGHPVDLERGTSDLRAITRRAARVFDRSGLAGLLRHVAYLSGRYNVIAVEDGTVTAIPDPCATQSMYWATRNGRFVLATHVELVARAVQAEVNSDAIARVDDLRSIRPGMTRFFAGIETPYRRVHPVIANCSLTWDHANGRADHARFYPFEDVPALGRDEAYAEFRRIFRDNCRLLASFGRTALSLTGGRDSRTTLAGARPFLGDGAFAFTYYNPKDKSDGHAADLFEANRLAASVGLPHRVLRWRRPEEGSQFDRVFDTTWHAFRPSDGAACAMYEELPRGVFQLQSMHAEVGTVFYRRRNSSPPDARRLAELFQGPRVAERAEYVAAFEEFIEYADFVPDRMGSFDHHDLFYWEHRDTRWAAQKPHEGDLGHRVLQPFNCRQLIEVMHGLPYEDRLQKVLLERFLADEGI